MDIIAEVKNEKITCNIYLWNFTFKLTIFTTFYLIIVIIVSYN